MVTPPPGDRKQRTQLRSYLGWLSFLRPSNPQEALALAVLASLIFAAGGAIVKTIEAVTAQDPWNLRADRACLDAGNSYLSAQGSSPQNLDALIRASEGSLSALRDIGNSVPLESALQYNSMLSDKEEIRRLLQRKLMLVRTGKSRKSVNDKINGAFAIYALHAEELGLYVCGQGTGKQ
jgi:hypothetical protein